MLYTPNPIAAPPWGEKAIWAGKMSTVTGEAIRNGRLHDERTAAAGDREAGPAAAGDRAPAAGTATAIATAVATVAGANAAVASLPTADRRRSEIERHRGGSRLARGVNLERQGPVVVRDAVELEQHLLALGGPEARRAVRRGLGA